MEHKKFPQAGRDPYFVAVREWADEMSARVTALEGENGELRDRLDALEGAGAERRQRRSSKKLPEVETVAEDIEPGE